MPRFRARKWLFAALACAAVGWPLMQLVQAVEHRRDPYGPVLLLHQVSLFQLEMLQNELAQAAGAKDLDGLNALRQNAYSAHYTHERLRMALNSEGELAPLASLEEMLQYIVRLQVGGKRALTSSDTGVFAEASDRFRSLYEAYKLAVNSKGEIISSQNREIERHDWNMYELFRQKRME